MNNAGKQHSERKTINMKLAYLSRRRLTALGLAITLFTISTTANTPITTDEVPNFHQVNERLYRGGQPTPGSLKRLAELGIKTVINIRTGEEKVETEEEEARAAGLQYFSLPLKQLRRPKEEQMARIMAVINDPANQPVFVHCRRGSDRTGTVIASYRIMNDGWTAKRAQKEADKLGMRWWEFGMKDYLRDLEKKQAKNVAANVSK
jgi:tyrosine-protein phosphatase SIW14